MKKRIISFALTVCMVAVMLIGTMPLSPVYADVVPDLTGAELNIVTGYLTLTGTNFVGITGASNDIDATKITISDGIVEHTRTLTAATSNKEIAGPTSAMLTVAGADLTAIKAWAIENGTQLGTNTYNIAVAAGWNGASSMDEATQTLTVSGNPTPALTSATLDVSSGQLILTGTDFVEITGASYDIDATKIIISDGAGGNRRELSTTSNVDITGATSATLTVAGDDLTAIKAWATQNGTQLGANPYNIAAVGGWNGVNSDIEVTQPLTVSGNISAPVAKIGGTEYTTLQSAFDAAADGQTIELLKDITLVNQVNINSVDTRNFTLDLKGKTLSHTNSSSDNRNIFHNGSGALTIKDSVGDGKISCPCNNGATILVGGGGTVNIESGIVETIGSNTGAIVLGDTSNLNVSGGTVRSAISYAIYHNYIGDITISNNALITSGITETNGGTIYPGGGSLTINGGTVENTGGGNAIYTGGSHGFATITANIPAGKSAIIKGGNKAMNVTPILTNSNVTVAARNVDGVTDVESYNSANIASYKYLRFEPDTAPGAPTGLAATPGNGQLALTWIAPAVNGGSPITGYQLSTDNGSNWTATGGTSTSCTVTGLTNGTTYTLKVRAVNAIGSGAASDAITATPSAPTYSIQAISNQILTALTAGYGSGTQQTETVTITKSGTGNLTSLATAISGANADSFTITQPTATTLTSGAPSTTFTVKAKDGLAAGTYTATVTVSATNMTNVTFTVTQVVSTAGGGNGGGGGGGGGSTTPLVTKIESGENVTGTNVENLVKEGKKLTVEGKAGEKLVLDTAALKNIDGQTKDSVKVEVKDVSEDHKSEQPGRLVFSLTITAGGKHITSFGNGTATVSLPYELKAGEKAKDVTVWYLAEDGTMTEVPCTYDATTKLATFKVNHFSLYVVGTADTSTWTNPFSDVKESSWFYDAVRYVSANELMNGTTDTAFNPGAKTTRGMIVTILWRMENEPKASKDMTFIDVKDGRYYRDAVAWASEKGIVGGYSADLFGPEDNITREQLAVILHNYASFKGYTMTASGDLSVFGDSGKVHSWSKDSLSWANAEGLINGKGSKLLDPLGAAERCQVAAILQRFIENTVK